MKQKLGIINRHFEGRVLLIATFGLKLKSNSKGQNTYIDRNNKRDKRTGVWLVIGPG